MFNFDLTKFFRAEAPRLRLAIKKNIASRQGYKGDRAPSNSTRQINGRSSYVQRKGKNHWLVNTGETMRKGIAYEYGKTSMRIFARDDLHSGRQIINGKIVRRNSNTSYADIFDKNVHDYSGPFGINKGNRLLDRMEFEAGKQTIRYLMEELPKKIMLKL